MQLLYLAVYNAAGQRRDVRFVPGQLNIVTGVSATGKSALLEMVEYCLGRDTVMMPVGPITATVTWYAALFLLPDGGRAFVARPAPQQGRASTQRAIGLIPADTADSRPEAISLLERAARDTPPDAAETAQNPDDNEDEDSGRRALARDQGRLRAELRALAAERQLLLDTFDGENDYRSAVQAQVGRLTSLSLLPNGSGSPAGDEAQHSCPVCGSALTEPDPTPAEMQRALDALQSQLAGVDEARPARRAALTSLDNRAAELRDQLRAADAALRALSEGDNETGTLSGQERRAFTRGRISATLATLARADDQALRRLELEYAAADRAVAALEAELDDNEERMQLDSRLAALSRDMTQWSQELALEHGEGVRLDINRLTVVTDTAQGPAPL